jgi:lipopolysaccharide exporter
MSNNAKYKDWIRSGFFSGLQKLSVPISSVLITMILAHKALTKEEMGVWALFMSITAIVELIRQGLVKTSLIKFINHSKVEDHRYVLGAALFLNAFITLLTAVVILIFTPYLAKLLKAPQLEEMLYLLQVGMLIMIPFSHFEWLMYGKTQFKGLFQTYLLRQGASLVLVYLVYLLNDKVSLNTLVIIYNVALLGGTLVAYAYVKPFLANSLVFSKAWIWQLLHFGKYVFGSGLSTLVFRTADQMMLSPILGTTLYNASQNIAIRIINLADIPSQTLGDILFPKSAKRENSSNPAMIKYYYEKTVGASLCFVLPMTLLVILFPKLIIIVLAGREYFDAIPYLQLVTVTGIFLAFLKQFGVIIDSTGRPQVNFIMITGLAVLHVIFCYFFLRYFHFLGAAYALLCSHLTGFIITQYILYRLYQINFINCFKYAFAFYPEFVKIVFQKLQWKKQ